MDSTKALRYALALMLTAMIGLAGCEAVAGGGGAVLEEALDLEDGDGDGGGGGGGGNGDADGG
nr:hypothetical protein [Planctomycetales bacterium]